MSFKRILFDQRSPEWLSYRRTKIGASEIATILNLNPWKTPRELFDNKLAITESNLDNARMQKGRELEPVALSAFTSRHYPDLEFEQPTIESIEFPWMCASLDGFNEDKGIVVESKSGKSAHKIAQTGVVPEHYYPQCQQILCVTGLDKMFFWSYYPEVKKGPKEVLIEVLRDDQFIFNAIKESYKFYQCMINLTPPEPGVDFI